MKKKTMALLSKASLCAIGALSGSSNAKADWSGHYFGVGVGPARTKSHSSETTFTNDGQSPAVGWTQGRFRGEVYNSVNSMEIIDTPPIMSPTTTPINSVFSDAPLWSANFSSSSNQSVGQVFWGVNFQQPSGAVYGAEVRATFGNFGSSKDQYQQASQTRTGSFNDSEGASFEFINYGSVLSGSGLTSPLDNWFGINYSIPFEQTGSIGSSVKFDRVLTALGRIGLARDSWMIYATAGLAQADIKLSTSGSITELVTGGEIRAGSIVGSGTLLSGPIAGTKTYSFAGGKSTNRLGLAYGLGAQWKLKDGYAWRLEGIRHEFGSLGASAASSQTQATYSVKQRVKLDQITVSIIKNF